LSLLPGQIATLFETEDNATRFERVCLELYERAEGVTLVPTSTTYDLGRDARQIGVGGASIPGVLCVSLSTGVDDKVTKDLNRLAKTTKTASIVFCSSRKLTEQAVDRLEVEIRQIYPEAESVRVLGQTQLVKLGRDEEDVLLRNYPGEINDIRKFEAEFDTADQRAFGLRLALSTHVGEDAKELRSEVGKRLILDQLRGGGPQTVAGLTARISQFLRLSHSMSDNVVAQLLDELGGTGLVDLSPKGFAITEAGADLLAAAPETATQRLLEGRVAVRDSLEALTGKHMPDPTFDKFWEIFQDAISQAFYDHGLTLINMVASITAGEAPAAHYEQVALLDRLADKTSAIFDNAELHDEYRQAVIDIFTETKSKAFEWLTSVCSVFVMMCSLGLESRSSREISDALIGLRLVPDTDILLSLLCEGEQNHEAAVRVAKGWKALGGTIALSTPTLEEVATHANIAQHDYESTKHLFDRLAEEDVSRVISNAFVRAFYKLEGGKANDRRWAQFIRQFRSEGDNDYSNVLRVLLDEFKATRLIDYVRSPLDTSDPKSLASRVTAFLRRLAAEDQGKAPHELEKRTLDKSRRDALLLMNLKASRESFRESGDGKSAIILSSARALRQAGKRFSKELYEPDAVVSLPAVAALLALMPGVNLGLKALRSILFDTNVSGRLSNAHRFAYRVVVASNLYDMPYARRVTMRRDLRKGLLDIAKATGKPLIEIEKRFTKPENAAESAQLIKGVLDEMAIEPRVKQLLEEQQAQIQALESEIVRLKESELRESA
jgi:hypothetical protein